MALSKIDTAAIANDAVDFRKGIAFFSQPRSRLHQIQADHQKCWQQRDRRK